MQPDIPRHRAVVREYLNALEDSELSRECEANALAKDDVLAFRAGRDDALSGPVVVTWSKLLGNGSSIETNSPTTNWGSWYTENYTREQARLNRYRQYDIMEATRGEAERALTATADMVVTGSVGEQHSYGGGFHPHAVDPNDSRKEILRDIGIRINQRLLPEDQKHILVRDMAKYGDWWEQIGLDKENRQTHITKLLPMPVRELRVLPNPTPASMYGLFPEGLNNTEPSATWPAWKIASFCNQMSRADTYGRSAYFASLRSWVQVEAMESGMIIRRLERAAMRYKHTLDLTGLSTEKERRDARQKYRMDTKKRKTIDTDGNLQMQNISLPPGEDFIVGRAGKDGQADVEAIQGDANLDQIADFNHFFSRYLSGLGPPKHQLGYEQDTMRSMGTELHIIFARKCRGIQMKFIKGLTHLYWVELLLRRIDPRDFPFVIFPPAMGTRDELVRAQVQLAHATTVRYLAEAFSRTGEMPSINWFLRHILNLDDEAISSLDLVKVLADIAKIPNSTDKAIGDGEGRMMQLKALESPEVAAEMRYTRFVLNERALSMMKPAEYAALALADTVPDFGANGIEHLARAWKLDLASPYCWA